ncbi:MAG TPA: DUF4179 domain-containing protein [Clostridia bacterium]|nr:DUF4179 domain-containing protein [Clostridia bacterium]
MKDLEEEMIFDLVDRIDGEEIWDRLVDWEESGEEEVTEEMLNRIKQKTYRKLNLAFKTGKKKRVFWAILAASLMIMVISISAFGPERVWAKIRQSLQFIPGMGIVIKDEEEQVERYVLSRPLEKELGKGRITIKGVIIDNQRAIIDIIGEDLKQYKDVFLRDKKGREYKMETYSIGASTGYWRGTFSHEGKVEEPEEIEVIIGDREFVIPLTLEKAVSYESYEEMGPSQTVKGISITAITYQEKGKLKVNLVSPSQPGWRIDSYADHPSKEGGTTISLRDKDGNLYPVTGAGSYSPPLSEFSFDLKGSKEESFILSIPFIRIKYDEEKTVTVNIPQEGSFNLDQSIDLAGFPINFQRIERLGDNRVRIYVDTGFNKQSGEGLQFFILDGLKLPFRSWSGEVDLDTEAIKWFEFEIKPRMRKIKLVLKEPVVVKQGPWEFPIQLNQ